jgi:hypothetical protein
MPAAGVTTPATGNLRAKFRLDALAKGIDPLHQDAIIVETVHFLPCRWGKQFPEA